MLVADLTSPVATKSTNIVTSIDIDLQAITFFNISWGSTDDLNLSAPSGRNDSSFVISDYGVAVLVKAEYDTRALFCVVRPLY